MSPSLFWHFHSSSVVKKSLSRLETFLFLLTLITARRGLSRRARCSVYISNKDRLGGGSPLRKGCSTPNNRPILDHVHRGFDVLPPPPKKQSFKIISLIWLQTPQLCIYNVANFSAHYFSIRNIFVFFLRLFFSDYCPRVEILFFNTFVLLEILLYSEWSLLSKGSWKYDAEL